MSKYKSRITAVFLFISFFLTSYVVLAQVIFLPVPPVRFLWEYDDFSGNTLNTFLWNETPGSNINNFFLDEHFVNVTEGAYHTAQLMPADKGVKLKLLRHTFVPGESVSYDLNYVNANGNRLHFIDIDDQNTAGIGLIGNWNGQLFCGGDLFGKYSMTVNFTAIGVDVLVKKPDGSVVFCPNFAGIPGAAQYNFAVVTRTGHNGIVHIDYDNFMISG